MLTAVLLATLTDVNPPHVRLIADEVPLKAYDSMTRAELLAEYDALEARRPGVALPITLVGVGGVGAIITAVAFWVPFSTPYGLAVYAAAIIITAFVVSLAMAGTGVALLALRKPLRDELGEQMRDIEDAYREGRCRHVDGHRPCDKDPSGPPPPRPPRGPAYVPQVNAPGPLPSLVVATF